jgi:site-specific DNA-methyltransferase (adenine-specific)
MATQQSKLHFENSDRSYRLFLGDSIKLLQSFPDESIDLIFADPPYFLSNGGMTCKNGEMVPVKKGSWDQSRGVEEDFRFQHAWLKESKRILKPNGSLFVSGTRHNIFSVGFSMQRLGYKLLNDITWYKPNPPPNLACRYFTHSSETVIWAARDEKAKWTFNYKLMKRLNGGKQMKSVWSILPPRKDEKLLGKHPTQKPVELLERIVLAASRPGDVVLDPFSGSGTTGIAARRLGRRYIGIELSPEYADLAVDRLLADGKDPNLYYASDIDYVASQVGLQ